MLLILLFVVLIVLLSEMHWFLGSLSELQGFYIPKIVCQILYVYKVHFSPQSGFTAFTRFSKGSVRKEARNDWYWTFLNRCELHILRWWAIINNLTAWFLAWKYRMDFHQFIHLFIPSLCLLTNTEITCRVMCTSSAPLVMDTVMNRKQILCSKSSVWCSLCAIRGTGTEQCGSTDKVVQGQLLRRVGIWLGSARRG